MDKNLSAIIVSRKTGEESWKAKGIQLENKLLEFAQCEVGPGKAASARLAHMQIAKPVEDFFQS